MTLPLVEFFVLLTPFEEVDCFPALPLPRLGAVTNFRGFMVTTCTGVGEMRGYNLKLDNSALTFKIDL